MLLLRWARPRLHGAAKRETAETAASAGSGFCVNTGSYKGLIIWVVGLIFFVSYKLSMKNACTSKHSTV